MRCQKTETEKTASEMPFYGVTNPELYNVLENCEIEIKRSQPKPGEMTSD